MGKKIETYAELVRVCKSVGLGYLGSFMMEFLEKKEMWSNPETKGHFMAFMRTEYDWCDSESSTRTRINCMIRIIESGPKMVNDALDMVLDTNDHKLDVPEAKINAQMCKDMLASGELSY